MQPAHEIVLEWSDAEDGYTLEEMVSLLGLTPEEVDRLLAGEQVRIPGIFMEGKLVQQVTTRSI
jgi:hypothetical protein